MYKLPILHAPLSTNVSYTIVEEFIIQFETSEHIIYWRLYPCSNHRIQGGRLSIIYFMKDYSDVEMAAVRSLSKHSGLPMWIPLRTSLGEVGKRILTTAWTQWYQGQYPFGLVARLCKCPTQLELTCWTSRLLLQASPHHYNSIAPHKNMLTVLQPPTIIANTIAVTE